MSANPSATEGGSGLKIGIAGLGEMGGAMMERLLEGGSQAYGYFDGAMGLGGDAVAVMFYTLTRMAGLNATVSRST